MAKVTVQLNLPGLNALMTSAAVQAVVDGVGESMSSSAGPDFEYTRGRRSHPWTARGYVQPANARGMREQARNAVLERVVGEAT